MPAYQLQVARDRFDTAHLRELPPLSVQPSEGQAIVQVDAFAYTSNNITYAVVGDMIGYWKFFPAVGPDAAEEGVIPVWGYGTIVASDIDVLPVGERLFGYLPTATYITLQPSSISPHQLFDATPHRQELPKAYNLYRRVGSQSQHTDLEKGQMLLYPLDLTAFCLWDALKEKAYYDAEQILILSASSKTSTGLAYALSQDTSAPPVIGITSKRNLSFCDLLGTYDQCLSYEELDNVPLRRTVIVDMSGHKEVVGKLHLRLSDLMRQTVKVGMTHWDEVEGKANEISERTHFFFAPVYINQKIKELGAATFDEEVQSFIQGATKAASAWLVYREVHGLAALKDLHPDVCSGRLPPHEGLIVQL